MGKIHTDWSFPYYMIDALYNLEYFLSLDFLETIQSGERSKRFIDRYRKCMACYIKEFGARIYLSIACAACEDDPSLDNLKSDAYEDLKQCIEAKKHARSNFCRHDHWQLFRANMQTFMCHACREEKKLKREVKYSKWNYQTPEGLADIRNTIKVLVENITNEINKKYS